MFKHIPTHAHTQITVKNTKGKAQTKQSDKIFL